MDSQPKGCLARLFAWLGGAAASTPRVDTLPYRLRDDFLSPAEASFFHVLDQVVGDRYTIAPKVGLGDLFFVPHGSDEQAYRNRISQKHVDFVLCDRRTLRPQLAIELDDASHRRLDRAARDTFVNEVFAAAGLPLVHIPVQRTYDVQQLGAVIAQALFQPSLGSETDGEVLHDEHLVFPSPLLMPNHLHAPSCAKCGTLMVLRTAQRGKNQGQPFYGCINFPRCREIVPVPAHLITPSGGL